MTAKTLCPSNFSSHHRRADLGEAKKWGCSCLISHPLLFFVFILSSVACLMATTASLRADDEAIEITITAHRSELLFDKKSFTVKAGRKVKVTLVNPEDSINLQPHNLLIIEPRTLQEVGTAASAELVDPTFLAERHAVPTSNYVLYHTKLLLPGESETLEFVAPTFPDDYPFLCSYPGHWSVMNGVMTVEE